LYTSLSTRQLSLGVDGPIYWVLRAFPASASVSKTCRNQFVAEGRNTVRRGYTYRKSALVVAA
jgi:hypothetical protein